MSDDLKAELTEIDGIGDVTAEKILEAVAEHDGTDSTVIENVRDAYDYYESGQESYAGKFLRRAYEASE